ncbi:hypothetical protein P4O66_002198 [Electrophorus voltai]|uniref:Endonuclease/exonuclease/phosphatase domain-containing protein n=1 Tax=Electrophorus voltai TaxID=2609070 RepID=A0AAD8Z1Y3_9TELE|nr:hypothetical protein P4O66_002198 [Electrophorus voltai]
MLMMNSQKSEEEMEGWTDDGGVQTETSRGQDLPILAGVHAHYPQVSGPPEVCLVTRDYSRYGLGRHAQNHCWLNVIWVEDLSQHGWGVGVNCILLANVQSLDNKLDDLRARIKFQRDIRDCNLLCFTESWLNPMVPNHAIQPAEFFSVHRMDRMADSGKSRGGGVCVMVNNSCCNNANVVTLACSCSPNLELLALKLHPFYLPREFTSVIINTVYIPPQANMETALCELHEALTQFQTQHRDAALIEVGDFSSANLKHAVPNLYQHVTFPTRGRDTRPLLHPIQGQLQGTSSSTVW